MDSASLTMDMVVERGERRFARVFEMHALLIIVLVIDSPLSQPRKHLQVVSLDEVASCYPPRAQDEAIVPVSHA